MSSPTDVVCVLVSCSQRPCLGSKDEKCKCPPCACPACLERCEEVTVALAEQLAKSGAPIRAS